ncbi:MAG: hypothetical protein M3141_09510, partial [Actinomycetota bacterium]|nr:hypothetical protein [Actinomycetota bacterium]
GQVVRLVGSIAPPKRGLTVLVWRRVRGGLRFAGRFSVLERGRGFSSVVRVRSAGLYRFQVRSRGDRFNAAGSSNVVWVRSVG